MLAGDNEVFSFQKLVVKHCGFLTRDREIESPGITHITGSMLMIGAHHAISGLLPNPLLTQGTGPMLTLVISAG